MDLLSLTAPNKHTSQITRLPTVRDYSDTELVDGITNNDIQVSAAFFDRYSATVNRLIWRLLGADADHDDVVNTVFLNIFSSIKKLKDPHSLSSWVATVSINTARKEIRKRRYARLFTFLTDTPENYLQHRDNTPNTILDRITQIVETMAPDNRIVFVLHYVEGYTFDEVASLRRCSLATAKRQGKRCKEAFMRKAKTDVVLSRLMEKEHHV